ncbi:MAG: hypothetical protein KDD62_16495, partial [Bdellovibrionales bacterium]|nr:hypothetical protein [Bdellovibrionales bacterium]
ETLKVGISQRKYRATRFEDNFKLICEDIDRAVEQGVKRLIFPELTIPGYMSLDLFKNPAYIEKNLDFLKKVIAYTQDKDVVVIVGYARPGERKANGSFDLYNSAAIIRNGIVLDTVDKTLLPAGDIFWERRYFKNGDSIHVTEIDGEKEGVLICEDLWDQDHSRRVAGELRQKGAQRLWALNASPYHRGKGDTRHQLLSSKAETLGVPLAYANLVGAQDGYHGEILFDGRSMIFDGQGQLTGLGE